MNRISRLLVLLAILGDAFCAPGAERPEPPGLSVSYTGELQLRGKPFRGIGVNYYDLFQRQLSDHPRSPDELRDALAILKSNRIPFIRFAACGYWPNDWRFYQKRRDEYFKRLEQILVAAESQGMGLIPSLFWHPPTLSDLAGEPFLQWGNPESKTRALMKEYVREVVSRYRDSSAVWAWEFGNELNLPADLPNAPEHRPPIVPALGTPIKRSEQDDLTHEALRSALSGFGSAVRTLDPQRLVLSGNAFPRPSAWHQMHFKSWARDSEEQWRQMIIHDNPDPLGLLSGRLYQAHDLAVMPWAVAAARQVRKPLFIGEFGVEGELTPERSVRFDGMLDAMEKSGVSLAALWVYDFAGQAKDWNVRFDNSRGELLRKVSERNRRWQTPGL